MKYILMCGGNYPFFETPKHFFNLNGERVIERTIRQLKENGVDDIAISTNNPVFDELEIPILHHENNFVGRGYDDYDGYWCEAFYPTAKPCCYLFGDVVFSDEAIKKIITTETDDIEFFASAPPFDRRFPKKSAEPFALKVINQRKLRESIEECKTCADLGYFKRKPIMWELWQIIKRTPLNIIDYTNYTVINDWTSDIDNPDDVKFFRRMLCSQS